MSGNFNRIILDTLCRLFFHGGYDGDFSKQSVQTVEPGKTLPPENKGGITRFLPQRTGESNQRLPPSGVNTTNAAHSGHTLHYREGV